MYDNRLFSSPLLEPRHNGPSSDTCDLAADQNTIEIYDPRSNQWRTHQEVMLTGRGFFGLGLIKGDRHEEGELMTPYKQCAPSLAAASGVATEHSVTTIPTVRTADLGLGGTAPAGSICIDACQDGEYVPANLAGDLNDLNV